MGFVIQKFETQQHIAELLTVGTDVLHRARANRSRNSAHRFDSGKPMFDRVGDEVIPVFASLHAKCDF